MIYRYVLHLEADDGRRTIQWTFAHPIAEAHIINLPTFGRWYVSRLISPDTAGAGVAYCTPVS